MTSVFPSAAATLPPALDNAGEVHAAPFERWQLQDGRNVTSRAARADDADRMQALVRSLSPRTRYLRFFNPLGELPSALLDSFTHADPHHALTLIACLDVEGREAVIGMGQYVSEEFPAQCEFALLVADGYQGAGLGSWLLRHLVCIAVKAGIKAMEGDLLAKNLVMRRVAEANGFTLSRHPRGIFAQGAQGPRAAAVQVFAVGRTGKATGPIATRARYTCLSSPRPSARQAIGHSGRPAPAGRYLPRCRRRGTYGGRRRTRPGGARNPAPILG